MTVPFALNTPTLGLALGSQFQAIGVGGPQGFANARAGHKSPWPYITGYFRFVRGYPYGTPRDRAQASNAPNLWAGHAPFYPLGYVKPQTGAAFAF